MTETKAIIAAFDFDGTLTYRDTLMPYVRYSVGTFKTFFNVIMILPYLVGFVLRMKTRQQVKEAFLTRSFKGKSIGELRAIGKRFALEAIPSLLNPKALDCLQKHQKQNHQCILVSATLNVYLDFWSAHMGFNHLVCTKLEEDAEGNATGKIEGINCWGEEKVVRLKKLLPFRKDVTLYAYGDSLGDKELLAFADFPFYRSFGE